MKRHKILSGVLAFSFPYLLNATVVIPLSINRDTHPLKRSSTETIYIQLQDSAVGLDSLGKNAKRVNQN